MNRVVVAADFAVTPFAVAVTVSVVIANKDQEINRRTRPTFLPTRIQQFAETFICSKRDNMETPEVKTMMSNLLPRLCATQGSCAPGYHSEQLLPLI